MGSFYGWKGVLMSYVHRKGCFRGLEKSRVPSVHEKGSFCGYEGAEWSCVHEKGLLGGLAEVLKPPAHRNNAFHG